MDNKLPEVAQIAVFEVEARRLGGSISKNQRRFMKSAGQKGREMEPTGPMAGSKKP
jgi:hypothetical protein